MSDYLNLSATSKKPAAGIYIHIPFCRQACNYCNFHFSTGLKPKSEMVQAIIKELCLQKDYFEPETRIQTIYFGGGTPSVLSLLELEGILQVIHQYYDVNPDAEITIESNPDDLDLKKLQGFKTLKINRLSIGVQSLYDEDLKWMNRSHSAEQAKTCIRAAKNAGIDNISADLIYGYHLLSEEKLQHTMHELIDLEVSHISSYCLTVEPKTALESQIRSGKQAPMNETKAVKQFQVIANRLQESGYKQYELSNWAKKGYIALHNSNYWNNVPYLGVGPSAHSYNKTSRQQNVSNNSDYIHSLKKEKLNFSIESLDLKKRINECIMVSIRRAEGLSLDYITHNFGAKYRELILESAKKRIESKWLNRKKNSLCLTDQGKLFADLISSELFIAQEITG